MKVEFLDSDVFGPELFVSASEFLKAEKNNKEYESLAHATEAFANLFGVEYHISEDEYDAVISQLEKTGAVIFTICEDKYPTRRWCEIYVSNNNQLQKVLYTNENRSKSQIKAKYNPKAIDAIRKRYETEEKR